MARLVQFSCNYVPGGELLVNPEHIVMAISDTEYGSGRTTLYLTLDRTYTVNLKLVEVRRAINGD